MSWLATLLGHPQVKDVEIETVGEITHMHAVLLNDKRVELQPMGNSIGVVQPRGGNRLYNGSEQSFNFCFKVYLEEDVNG